MSGWQFYGLLLGVGVVNCALGFWQGVRYERWKVERRAKRERIAIAANSGWVCAMCTALGVDPDHARRVVIDINVDDVVLVYVQRYGLEAGLHMLMDGVTGGRSGDIRVVELGNEPT